MSDSRSENAGPSQSHDEQPSEALAPAPSKTVPLFRARRLRWQIGLDRVLRLGVAIGVLILLIWVTEWAGGSALAIALAVALAIGAWMLINGISARTSTELPRLTAMIDDDPAQAEEALAYHLGRRPLLRWVRLLLYHRLAMLRHRQGRYAEAATICHHVLNYKLGPGEGARPHLLLLLAEAQIDRNDAAGAYPAIAALHQSSLNLVESMQRLALQTRYELLAGFPRRALWHCRAKLLLAELMPAEHNSAVHAMLATAADRAGRRELSHWLWQRLDLLADEQHRQQFREGRFSLNLGNVPRDVTEPG